MTKPDQSVSDIMASIRKIMAEDGESAPEDASVRDADETAPSIEVDPVDDDQEPLLLNTALEAEDGSSADHDVLLLTDPLDPVPGTDDADTSAPSADDAVSADPIADSPDLLRPSAHIVSPVTEAAVAAALSRLTGQSMDQGATDSADDAGQAALEKLIRDALRPALRSWLDENLPPIVESIVEREVARLMNRQQSK